MSNQTADVQNVTGMCLSGKYKHSKNLYQAAISTKPKLWLTCLHYNWTWNTRKIYFLDDQHSHALLWSYTDLDNRMTCKNTRPFLFAIRKLQKRYTKCIHIILLWKYVYLKPRNVSSAMRNSDGITDGQQGHRNLTVSAQGSHFWPFIQ